MPLDPQFLPFLEMVNEGGWSPLSTGDPDADRDRYRRLSLLRRGAGFVPEPVADVEDRSIDGPGGELRLRVYRVGGRNPSRARPVVVWLHGGGWMLGDLDTVDPICRRVANALRAVVVSVDYRLAPEHPHPAALDDAMAALRWAAERWPDAPLVVGGDSAGGGLAAGAALRARDEGGLRLAVQVLAYPALDPSQALPSVAENGSGLFLTAADMADFYAAHVPGGLAHDPRVAVLGADLHDLPPAVVATAEFDPLRDEGDRYAEQLSAAGVPVTHLPGPGLVHGFLALGGVAAAAAVRRDEVLGAVADLLDGPAGEVDVAGTWPRTQPLGAWVQRGDARLAVDLRGGGLRRLVVGGWDVLDGYPAGTVPAGRRGGVLLPWPNRLRAGRWRWADRDLQLDVVSPESPNAIHGLVSAQPWSLLASSQDGVTVGTLVEPRSGYPFRLAAAVDYRLAPEQLTVTVRVRNAGDADAPFGVGMHPYLHVGAAEEGGLADAELTVPARTALDVDGGLPVGTRRAFDGAVGRIGDRELDDPVTDLVRDDDGWARVRLRGPAGALELAVDGSWPWLQVYSGDTLPSGQRRRSLAVEPMTCPPNALANEVDLVVLTPGETWSGTWTLRWTPA
ncbi:Acetyl esterase/lipase [Modestobacter sp. DSM 44400]|uniref:aldose epimerase family protein n=1 Tax=Modestobacter sp. DSM 44400 TaxID=1550230 RepID=UPI00089B9EF9|nr:alpha/beta hydrolase fold domain-containing protein [Modestobacter sp. DSM 44400]SDY24064.1 Acetyl esterase/lipase [Modestobacter sp. DSM 44400]